MRPCGTYLAEDKFVTRTVTQLKYKHKLPNDGPRFVEFRSTVSEIKIVQSWSLTEQTFYK